MHAHPIQESPIETELLAFAAGDHVMWELEQYATTKDITAGRIAPGIGAFSEAVLAFFNTETNEYEEIHVDEPTEVVSLSGNIALFEGVPRLHVHAMLSKRDGSCVGGHLVSGVVNPTLEVFVTKFDEVVHRYVDERTGLPLLEG